MRYAAITGAMMAALAAGAVATPTFAQSDPCHAEKHENGTTGAVVGGIAGALLGSSIAPHHENRAGGAVIGGVAGALAGNAIGRSSAEHSDACRGYSYDGTPSAEYYSAPTSAYVPASGYYDSDGEWHAYAPQVYAPPAYAPSASYYGAPTSAYAPASGYYDRDGVWHAYARGYYDSYGEWHPY